MKKQVLKKKSQPPKPGDLRAEIMEQLKGLNLPSPDVKRSPGDCMTIAQMERQMERVARIDRLVKRKGLKKYP